MSEAVFGLIGVLVGLIFTWAKDIWSGRIARKGRARYLAMRVVCILDEYVHRCTEVAMDNGQRNKDGYLETQIARPFPPSYPSDVDWNSINHKLMYRLLTLTNRAEAANRIVESASENAFPPDYDEVYEERHYQYAKLGLAAIGLAQEIRRKYGILDEELAGWNPVGYLEKVKAGVEELRRGRMASLNELMKSTETTAGHEVS